MRIISIYLALFIVIVLSKEMVISFSAIAIAIGLLFLIDDHSLGKTDRKVKNLMMKWFN